MIASFLWGAATSSHQVEGGNQANDWWDWEQTGKVREKSGLACDQFHCFQDDIERIAKLGHTAHRFSLEWSRLEPEEGRWDEGAMKHYQTFIRELRRLRIEPVVTLHHFTNPLWFSKKGGWKHRDAVALFSRYVERAIQAFGDDVRVWVTINEPLVYLYLSYFSGEWPPGEKSFPAAMKVFRHLLHAHLEAYRVIHRHYEARQQPVWVSIAKHMIAFEPCRENSLRDRLATALRAWFFNTLYFDALQSGFLFFPGLFAEALPARGGLDFLGVNYYRRDFIRFSGWAGEHALGVPCSEDHHQGRSRERNMMGWDIDPEGFGRILKSLKRFRLPVMVLENGIPTLEDTQRIRYIEQHVSALKHAKGEGVPIRGYFYWSLLDNFEWAHGYGPRFGIFDVNFDNQTRKMRPSAHVLTESCRNIK